MFRSRNGYGVSERQWLGLRQDRRRSPGHVRAGWLEGLAQLVKASYCNSFLAEGECRVASARACKLVGGGDWVLDRLVPDARL